MSETCSCELAGFCSRRNVKVNLYQHKLCKAGKVRQLDEMFTGQNVAQPARGGSVVKVATGRKPCSTCKQKKKSALARAVDRAINLKNAAVDFVQDGMHVATTEQQQHRSQICAECPLNNQGWCDDTKGGCGCNLALKVMPRSSHCPLGKWSAYRDEYRPLLNPARSLMFHLYPLKGKEWNWHGHIEQIRQHQDKFNGKIVIGVGIDGKTATMEQVQELFHGIRVDHWLRADNNKLAETLTHVEMMSLLKTDDPNHLIFRAHTKGVTHQRDSVEQKWAEILWDGNMDLPSVDDALTSHGTCGVMRSQTPLVKSKPGAFFYAGSFYWMRAKQVFERDWTWKENNRWISEYVPSHLFEFAESACIFHDLVPSSVLNHGYFAEHVDVEWQAWKAARNL